MANTSLLFETAQLAEASYADFPAFDNTLEALIGAGLSSTQAEDLIQHWALVPNSHQPNTSSGYSATLFQSLDNTNEYVYAIRGTEPEAFVNSADLAADVGDIVVDGLAA